MFLKQFSLDQVFLGQVFRWHSRNRNWPKAEPVKFYWKQTSVPWTRSLYRYSGPSVCLSGRSNAEFYWVLLCSGSSPSWSQGQVTLSRWAQSALCVWEDTCHGLPAAPCLSVGLVFVAWRPILNDLKPLKKQGVTEALDSFVYWNIWVARQQVSMEMERFLRASEVSWGPTVQLNVTTFQEEQFKPIQFIYTLDKKD